MKYSDLNLKINTEYNIAKIGDQQVKVLKYLPIKDKIDLIQIALQKAHQDGIYNELKIDMYFNLYLLYLYTDIEFTDEEKANEELLYDELESNGIFIEIVNAMEDDEYESLLNYLELMQANNEVYRNSFASLLTAFIEDLPKNAEAAAAIVDNFDKEKYQNVLNFAKQANAGRPV